MEKDGTEETGEKIAMELDTENTVATLAMERVAVLDIEKVIGKATKLSDTKKDTEKVMERDIEEDTDHMDMEKDTEKVMERDIEEDTDHMDMEKDTEKVME